MARSPPFRMPVFVLTDHASEPWVRQGGTTFSSVTDGIESTLEQARAAAGRLTGAAGCGTFGATTRATGEKKMRRAFVSIQRGMNAYSEDMKLRANSKFGDWWRM